MLFSVLISLKKLKSNNFKTFYFEILNKCMRGLKDKFPYLKGDFTKETKHHYVKEVYSGFVLEPKTKESTTTLIWVNISSQM